MSTERPPGGPPVSPSDPNLSFTEVLSLLVQVHEYEVARLRAFSHAYDIPPPVGDRKGDRLLPLPEGDLSFPARLSDRIALQGPPMRANEKVPAPPGVPKQHTEYPQSHAGDRQSPGTSDVDGDTSITSGGLLDPEAKEQGVTRRTWHRNQTESGFLGVQDDAVSNTTERPQGTNSKTMRKFSTPSMHLFTIPRYSAHASVVATRSNLGPVAAAASDAHMSKVNTQRSSGKYTNMPSVFTQESRSVGQHIHNWICMTPSQRRRHRLGLELGDVQSEEDGMMSMPLEAARGATHTTPSSGATSKVTHRSTALVRSSMRGSHPVEQKRGRCRQRLYNILGSNMCELLMGFLIIASAIVMGVEVNHTAHQPTAPTPALFQILNYFFTVIFVVELVFHLIAEGTDFLRWRGVPVLWNYLDVLIVTSSLLEVCLDVYNLLREDGRVNQTNFRMVQIVRIIRLLRLFRIGRILRFVKALQMLIVSILYTLKSVIWSLILLLMIIYVFGMVLTQAASDYVVLQEVGSNPPDLTADEADRLVHHWGTLEDAMLTLFMAISGGVSWDDVARPLRQVSVIWLLIFLCFISFTYFAVLNVVTGVFCQSAMQSVQSDQEAMVQSFLDDKKLYIHRFEQIFHLMDTERTGYITRDQFIQHCQDDTVQTYFSALDLESTDALALFKLLDADPEMGIEVEDFVMACCRLKGYARSVDVIRLLHESRAVRRHLSHIASTIRIEFAKLADRFTTGISGVERQRGLRADEPQRSSATTYDRDVSVGSAVFSSPSIGLYGGGIVDVARSSPPHSPHSGSGKPRWVTGSNAKGNMHWTVNI